MRTARCDNGLGKEHTITGGCFGCELDAQRQRAEKAEAENQRLRSFLNDTTAEWTISAPEESDEYCSYTEDWKEAFKDWERREVDDENISVG